MISKSLLARTDEFGYLESVFNDLEYRYFLALLFFQHITGYKKIETASKTRAKYQCKKNVTVCVSLVVCVCKWL